MQSTTTLITSPLNLRRDMFGTLRAAGEMSEGVTPEREFNIESADSFVVRQSINQLLKDRYGWRGYHSVSLPTDQTADRTTLTATADGAVIGTITVNLEGSAPLNCEQVFADELVELRARYGRLCEFSKLAIDPVAGSNRVLVGLFHVAYIVACRLRGYDAVVMEVNPRHVRYYERMLGGQIYGSERLNLSVHAPAVLLVIDFAHVAEQIALRAGQPPVASDRSLYSFAFTPQEEEGIVGRMMAAQKPASMVVN